MSQIKIIDPYENYEPVLQEDASGVYGNDLLGRVQSLQVGFGSKVLRVDRDGLWLGSDHFSDAPFKVDMEGNITAETLELGDYIPVGGALGDIGIGNITGTYIANGAITTAKLTATAIDGMTITGAIVRTSSSTTRVQLNASTNALEVRKSGTVRVSLDDEHIVFYDSVGGETGKLGATISNIIALTFPTTKLGFVVYGGTSAKMAVGNTSIVAYVNLDMQGNDIVGLDNVYGSGSEIDWYSQLDMNNYEIKSVFALRFQGRNVTSLSTGQMAYHDSGGTQQFRCNAGGFFGRIVLDVP